MTMISRAFFKYPELAGPLQRVKVKWQRYRKERRPWKNQNLLNNVLTNFKRHLKKAGIEPEEGRTLSVQTLRKSCIQNWANNITNPEVVRVLAGHSDLKTTNAVLLPN